MADGKKMSIKLLICWYRRITPHLAYGCKRLATAGLSFDAFLTEGCLPFARRNEDRAPLFATPELSFKRWVELRPHRTLSSNTPTIKSASPKTGGLAARLSLRTRHTSQLILRGSSASRRPSPI
jgi:hypothetical protein